jgi:serine/threonine-protein kinase HipA
VPDATLLPVGQGEQALVLERFDRAGDRRRHVQSLAAVLEADVRVDLVDYAALLERTLRLTRDYSQAEQALRLAAFNVLAGNRDDHIKNVSFVMEPDGRWRLAPAYDLTWSAAAGYHAMSCDGESRAPDAGHVERVGLRAGFDRSQVRAVIEEVREALSRWDEFADASQVPAAAGRLVAGSLRR